MGRLAGPLLALLLAAPFLLPAWSADDAIAAMRGRLRTRGFGAEVISGPMVAMWSEEAPSDPLASNPAMPPAVRAAPPGAYLVVTEAGDWWAWPSGADQGPLVDPPPLW